MLTNNSINYSLFLDVQGCNEDQNNEYYYNRTCSLLQIPGDNIIYSTQAKWVYHIVKLHTCQRPVLHIVTSFATSQKKCACL